MRYPIYSQPQAPPHIQWRHNDSIKIDTPCSEPVLSIAHNATHAPFPCPNPSALHLAPAPPPLRQLPRPPTHHLPLTKRPEIHPHAHQIIDARVRALVQQQRRQRAERVDDEAGFHAAVHHAAGDEGGWVFPAEGEEAEQEVEALQDGDGFDGRVEGLGEEVPEDFGPEVGVQGGGELV